MKDFNLNNIERLIEAKGITRNDLAKGIGVSFNTIKTTIDNERCTTDLLELIAKYLNVPLTAFIEGYEIEVIPQQIVIKSNQ